MATAGSLAAVSGHGVVWLLTLALLAAVAVRPSGSTLVAGLPLGFVTALGSLFAVATISGLFHVILFRRWSATTAACLLIAAFAVAASRRVGRTHLGTRSELVALLPAYLPIIGAAALALSSLPRRLGWFLQGWDNLVHVLFVGSIQERGYLDYSTDGYPQGMHSVVAWLTALGPASANATPELLAKTMSVQVLLSWVTYGVLVAASSLIAARLAADRTAQRSMVAGVLGGGLLLSGGFFTYSTKMGYQTSIMAAAALTVAAWALVAHPTGDRRQVLTLTAALIVTAGTWQVLLPVAGVIAILPIVRWLRVALNRRNLVDALVALLLLVGAAASLTPVVAVVRLYGLDHAAEDAYVSLPWFQTGLAVILAIFALRPRAASVERLVAAAVLTTVVLALAMTLQENVDLTSYYPQRTMWFAATLGLPLAVGTSVRVTAAFRPTLAFWGIAGATSIALGAVAVTGPIVTPQPRRNNLPFTRAGTAWAVLPVALNSNAQRATVVATGALGWDDFAARVLVRYYHLAGIREVGYLPRSQMNADLCAELSGAAVPTILAPSGALRSAQLDNCSAEVMARVQRLSIG